MILYYGFSTQKRLIIQFFSDSLIINIPPAPFKGGDVMVSIHERHFGQPLTLQRCIILRQVFGYVEKVLELCGVKVTEKVIDTMDTSLKEEQRLLKKAQRKLRMEQSRSYRAMKTATKVMDDYYLDPILGLVPVVGDVVPQLFNASFFYISIFKIRSYALTMTLLRNVFIDIFVGLIPYAGIVLDVFYKSYRENTILIEGFVNDDPNIVKKVKQRAVSTTIWLVVLGVAIYYLIVFLWSVVTHLYQWIMSYI